MSSGRRETIWIGVTVLALSAGVVAGMVASRLPAKTAGGATIDSPGLAQELQLTPAQSDQVRQVWEAVRDDVRNSYQKAETLQRQRDEEVVAMLDEAQKAKFEKITQSYGDRLAALRHQRDQAFAQAVRDTRKLLNDQQRRRYDALLASNLRPDQIPGAETITATTTTTMPVR